MGLGASSDTSAAVFGGVEANNSLITVSTGNRWASNFLGPDDAHTVTVVARDSANNAVAGVTVVFTPQITGMFFTPTSCVTNAAGGCSVQVTSYMPNALDYGTTNSAPYWVHARVSGAADNSNYWFGSNATTKAPTITFSNSAAMLTPRGLPSHNNAGANRPISLSCDRMYAAKNGAGFNGGGVFEVGTPTTVTSLLTPVFAAKSTWTVNPMSTIAIGRKGGSPAGKVTMYTWPYDGLFNQSFAQLHAIEDGETTKATPLKPAAISFYPAGGEMNQKTGQLYFIGPDDSTLGAAGTTRMRRYDPETGIYDESGVILPASGETRTFTFIQSDMAIDADGNIYVFGYSNAATNWLVRIVPGPSSGTWRYNSVVQVNGLPAADDDNIWGMAFFNGVLYLANPYTLYALDVMSGQATSLGAWNHSLSIGTVAVYDLASCHTAPVIEGTVYNDVNGDGAVSTGEGLARGITVQIYKQEGGTPVLKGERVTDASGNYSFIVNDPNATYYIRLKQPRVGATTFDAAGKETNGVNAAQTWANAGTQATNTVTAYCNNGTSPVLNSNTGICLGARPNGADPASVNGNLLTQAQYVSRVTMTSDQNVANVSFGLTAARDYGDAPSSYGTLIANNGPAHVAGGAQLLQLGAGATVEANGQPDANANLDQYDDGVQVVIDGTNVPLQAASLVAGRRYTFRVNVSDSPARINGRLNAWIGLTGAGAVTTTFATQIATNLQDSDNDGIISFDYTIPSGGIAGIGTTYLRFRWSSTPGLAATGNPLQALGSTSTTTPWALDGEVEDYKITLTSGQLRLSKLTKGGVGSFTYALGNISNTAPSTNTATLATTAANTVVSQDASVIHAFSALNTAITVTESIPAGWLLDSVACVDAAAPGSGNPEGALSGVSIAGNVITIPATNVRAGADIGCVVTNGLRPRIEVNKTIIQRRNPSDQFEIRILDSSSATIASATTSGSALTATTSSLVEHGQTYTVKEIAAGSPPADLSRYLTEMSCVNNHSDSDPNPDEDRLVSLAGEAKEVPLVPLYGDDISCVFTNTPILPSTTSSTIESAPSTLSIDGQSTITVVLKDEKGVQIASGGDTVTMASSLASSTIGPVTDNKDGTYTATLISTTPGIATISFTVNGGDAAATTDVTFSVGSADKMNSIISATPTSTTVDGSSVITVTLKDGQGNTLTSGGDTVTMTSGLAGSVIGPITDNQNGTYTTTLNSTVPGTTTVSFTVNGGDAATTTDVTFTVGSADKMNSAIAAVPANTTVDGSSVITVTLKDGQGNNLTSGGDTVTMTSSLAGSTLGPVTDNGDGTYRATLTSTVPGTANISFTVNGGDAATTTDVTFTVGSADKMNSTIAAVPTSTTVDGSSVITVTLKDGQGNTLTTGGDTVTMTSSLAGSTLDPVTDNGDGTYRATLTSTVPGTATVSFTVNGGDAATTTDVTFTVGSADKMNSAIAAIPAALTTDDSSTVTVTLKDSQGNNLTVGGDTVTINSNLAGSALTGVTDNNNGTYTATLTATTPGTAIVGFSVNGGDSENTATVAFTAGAADATASSLEVLEAGPLAAGSPGYTVQATVRDRNNNPVEGTRVTFSFTGGTQSNAPCTSEADGICTVGWRSNVSGTFQVAGGIATGTLSNSPIDRTFVPGAASATTSSVSVLETGPLLVDANGGVGYTVQALVLDANNNPVVGEVVTFIVSGGNLDKTTCTTAEDGLCTATWTSTVANTFQVSASITDGTLNNSPINRTFAIGAANANTSIINAAPTSTTVDGNSLVTVTLKDAQGNDLASGGATVAMATSLPGSELTPVADNGDGTYTATLTSTAPGSATISFTVNGASSANTATVTFTVGAANASNSTIAAVPTSTTVDGNSLVTVTLKDARGNNLSSGGAIVVMNSSLAGSGLTPVADNGDGTYSATLTSTAPGSAIISFTVNGTSSANTATVTFTVGAANASNSTIAAVPTSTTVDGNSLVTITLKDAQGNNLSSGGATVVMNSSLAGSQLTPVTDNGDGTYSATLTSTTPGSTTISFTVNGASSANTATVAFTVGAADANTSTITAVPTNTTVDGNSLVTVTLKDAQGNNLSSGGANVVMNSSLAGSELTSVADNGDGTYSATLTSTAPGSATISFTVNGESSGNTAAVTFAVGSANSNTSTIVAIPTSTTVDGNSLVTVTLKDAQGNNLTSGGATVVMNSSLTGSQLTPVADNGDGTYTATLTSTAPGSATISFTVNGASSANTATITFTVGAANANTSTITAVPTSTTVDGNSLVTVTLKDARGNNLSSGGAIVVMNSSLTGSGLTPVTDNGDGTYSATLTSTAPGSATITFTVNGTSSANTATVTFAVGAANANNSTIAAVPTNTTIDGNSLITVTLKDAQGNNLSSGGANVVMDSSLVGSELTSVADNGDGTYSATLTSTAPGSATISFTVNGTSSANTATVTFAVGAANANTSTITSVPTNTTIDGDSLITVTLKDAQGNNLTSGGANVVMDSSLVGSELTSAADNGDGTYSATLTSTAPGSATISFTVNGTSSANTATVAFTVGAANANTSTITAVPTNTTVDGNSLITVTLKDGQGNNLSSGGATVAMATSLIGSELTPVTDNGDGTYSATLTSAAPGSAIISFTVDGASSSNTAVVTFTVGTANANTSTIAAVPTNTTVDSNSVITVTLKDAQGNNLGSGGATVAMAISLPGSELTPVADNGDGTYTATLTSTAPGSATISYTVNGASSGNTATVAFTVGTADANTSAIAAVPTNTTIDGDSLITVTLKDAQGNNLSSGGATVVMNSSLAGSGLTPVADNGDGTYTATLTSTAPGSATISFTVNGASSANTATVAFTVGAANANTSTITAVPTNTTIDGNSLVTVTLKDAQGNNLSSGGANVVMNSSLAGSELTSVADNGDGTYSATLTSTAPGSATISFTVNGTSSANTATVTFAVGAANANTSTITSVPTNTTIDGDSLITVTLKDAQGNNLTSGGATVVMATSLIGSELTPVADNGDGTYSATLTSTAPGSAIISFTVDGASSSNTAVVTFTVGTANANTSTIAAVPTNTTVDGNSLITVTLKDAQGNNLSSGGATIIMNSSLAGSELTSVADNGDGTYSATLTSTAPGSTTISFTVNGASSANTATVAFTVGAADANTSTITAVPTNTTVDGNSLITVTLKDAQGNNLTNGGATVTMNSSLAGSGLTPVTDNGDGTYSATLTSTAPGNATISFTVNGVSSTNTTTVTFGVGAASSQTSDIVAIPTSTSVDGESQVTVTLRDGQGNNLSNDGGASVTMASSLAGTALTPVTDNLDGTYSATLTSTVPGTTSVSFEIDGEEAIDTAEVEFDVGAADAQQSTISATPTSTTIDGNSLVTIRLKDAQGNNLSDGGASVTVRTSLTGSALTPVTDNLDGSYTATLNSTLPGIATVSFTVGGAQSGNSATVTFSVGSASAQTSTIAAVPTSTTIDGNSRITVTLKDAQGNNLSSGGDTVSLTSSLAGTTVGTVTDNRDGSYSALLTSSLPGTTTVSFTVNGTNANATANVEFGVGAADAATSTIAAVPTTLSTDASSLLTVTLKDAQGNSLTRGGDTVAIDSSLAGTSLTNVVDQNNGTYTAALTSTVPGTTTLSFLVNGAAGGNTATVTFNIGNASAQTSTIVAVPTSTTTDGDSRITVTLKDAQGNTLTNGGATVALASSLPGSALTPVTDNQDGTYSATLTATAPGTATVSFSVNGSSANATATVQFGVGAASAATSTITAIPGTLSTDDSSLVTVIVKDAQGHPLTDGGDSVTIDSSLAGTRLTNVTNNSDGSYTATLTSSVPGTTILSFAVNGARGANTATVAFDIGVADAQTSTIAAIPTSTTVDNDSGITVTLKDAQGNSLTRSGGSVTMASDLPGTTLTAVIDNQDGTYSATLTSTVSGTTTVSFSINGTPGGNTADVTFGVGAASAQTSTITATPASTTVDGNSLITVTLKDAQGNNLGGGNDTVVLNSSLSGTSLTTAANQGDGTYTATLTSTVAGNTTVSFTVNGANSGNTATVSFSVGTASAATSSIIATPTSTTVDGNSLITVTLKDAQGNNLGSGGDTVVMVSSLAGTTLTNVTDRNDGSHVATLTSTVAGNTAVSFAVNGNSSPATANVAFAAGTASASASSLGVSSGTRIANGNAAHTATVTVRDAGNNPVAGASVAFTVAAGATPSATSCVSQADGTCQISITSTLAGDYAVSALIAGAAINGSPTSIRFVPDSMEIANSALALSTGTRLADGRDTHTVTVTLRDANDNPLPGMTVVLDVDGSASITVAGSGAAIAGTGNEAFCTTASDGTCQATVTSTRAGNVTVSARIDTAHIGNSPGMLEFGAAYTLSMRKSIAGQPLQAGKAFDYVFTFRNDGLADADKVNFADLVPNGIRILATPSGGYCTVNGIAAVFPLSGDGGTVLTCSIATIVPANGGSASVLLPAMPDSASTGTQPVNHASWSEGGDSPPENPTPGQCRSHCTDDGGPSQPIEAATDAALRLTKQAGARQARIGDTIRYSVTIENQGESMVAGYLLQDTPPAGFSLVQNSVASSDGSVPMVSGNNPVRISQLSIPAGGKVTVEYLMRIGASVRPGTYSNQVQAYQAATAAPVAASARASGNAGYKLISNAASAQVTITGTDPLLDEALIFGAVFHDRNRNTRQDPGEEGVPGVRIVSAGGFLIETDQYGRYSLPGILGGSEQRGRNFILKVDPATLPEGSDFTTANPLVRRITPGVPVRFDFGVYLPSESPSATATRPAVASPDHAAAPLELELGDAFFAPGKAALLPQYQTAFARIVALLDAHGGGRVLMRSTGVDTLDLARARTVREALDSSLAPALASKTTVVVKADLDDPDSLLFELPGEAAR